MTDRDRLYRVTKADRKKRRGDRRRIALQALASAAGQHRSNPKVEPSLTPEELAAAWHLHPSSAFRVLERLRKQGAVTRRGRGVNADYEITAKGVDRLEYLNEVAKLSAKLAERRGRAAANQE